MIVYMVRYYTSTNMGDFDKSLDDIIKHRQFGVVRNAENVRRKAGLTMPARNQFRSGKPNLSRKFVGGQIMKNRAARLQQKPQKVQDARQKLQRLKVKDARETLLQKGRLVDARQKLNEKSQIKDAREKLNNLTRQNQNYVTKTGKQTVKPNFFTRTVSNSGLLGSSDGRLKRARLMNNSMTRNSGKQVMLTGGGLTVIARSSLNTQNHSFDQQSSIFSRTVDSLTKEAYSQSSSLRQASNPVLKKRQLSSDESEEEYHVELIQNPSKKKLFTLPVEPPDVNRGISTSLQSRLGKQISTQRGYRVIVSNLHSLVSERDLEDLFGDIGPVDGVQILQVGVAEVIYQRLIDAQKSVTIYNKRELDGKPMGVKLINMTKPPQTPAPVPQKYVGTVFHTGTLRCDQVQEISAKSRITPDAGLFHKVLFQRGSLPAAARPHAAFTVTM